MRTSTGNWTAVAVAGVLHSAGVSNCINRLRLADGSRLSVRHPHRMAEVPWLSPGERVNLRRA